MPDQDVAPEPGHPTRDLKTALLIPETPIVAATSFPAGLAAPGAAAAIARGLLAGGRPRAELFPVAPEIEGAQGVRELLDAVGFDAHMHRARAVIVGEGCPRERIGRRSLNGSAMFEIATRARQAGVPTYAVLAIDALDSFDARMLDLQVVLEARDAPDLIAAGRRLADLI
jgi:glycerate kinase